MNLYNALTRLLKNEVRVDRFDASYLTDIKHILKENYNITDYSDITNQDFNVVKDYLKTNRTIHWCSLDTIDDELRLCGIKDSDFMPDLTTDEEKIKQQYNTASSWDAAKDLRYNQETSDNILKLQADYSERSVKSKLFTGIGSNEFWGRPEIGTLDNFIYSLISNKQVDNVKPCLTLGPRFSEEILYFRNNLKLEKTIGLDLFSNNANLVIVGDMHNMPFKDSTFELVYQKNTFDKAYNIRKTLDECVRVLKNGGVLISDQSLDYTMGVNEIARTNITSNKWFSMYLRDNIDEVLLDVEAKLSFDWVRKAGQYAVKIKK